MRPENKGARAQVLKESPKQGLYDLARIILMKTFREIIYQQGKLISTFSTTLVGLSGRIRAPLTIILKLRPPRIKSAPRHPYNCTRYWKSGENAKEDKPTPVKPRPIARERRVLKYCITEATVGVKTSAQPDPKDGFEEHDVDI